MRLKTLRHEAIDLGCCRINVYIGEGDYAENEEEIQALLGER
ncbi:MAG: hypothetical protein ACHBNF_22855 [Chromatiales bacterium]